MATYPLSNNPRLTAGAEGKVWPVFNLDFNQAHGFGRVWTVISDAERTAWHPLVGREVIAVDLAEALRFYGTVTSIKPAKTPGRWVIDVQVGPEWRWAGGD